MSSAKLVLYRHLLLLDEDSQEGTAIYWKHIFYFLDRSDLTNGILNVNEGVCQRKMILHEHRVHKMAVPS